MSNLNNQNTDTNNTTNLAEFIDTDNTNDPTRYHAPEAPQNAPVAHSDETSAPTSTRRFEPWKRFSYVPQNDWNASAHQIVEGALLEGKLTKAELLNDRNGFPFLKITVALNEPQGWNLSHCHFFPRQKATNTEAVLELTSNYLQKFGYVAGSNDYSQTVCLVQVGQWTSDDGRTHLNAAKLFRDKVDYDNYQQWLQTRQQRPPVTREPMTLPAI